jgi:hypothetical protein
MERLLLDRLREHRVDVAMNEHGSWDVVIRIEGGYATEDDARSVVPWWTELIEGTWR